MKLSEIKNKLEIAISLLKTLTYSPVSGVQNLKFDGIIKFKEGLKILEEIGVFGDELSTLQNSPLSMREADAREISTVEGRPIRDRVINLIQISVALLQSLTKVVGNEEDAENCVFIKLPATNDLKSLLVHIEIFDKILSQTILDPKIGGNIILENVEPGSVWLKVYLGSTLAVTVIGSLAWSSAVVYKKYQEAKVIEEYVNRQQIENEERTAALNASKILTDIFVKAEAEHIYHTYYENGEVDHEQIERIKNSIKMLSEAIHKGAEINPALTAPEQVSNLFPDMKALSTIESKIKRIEK